MEDCVVNLIGGSVTVSLCQAPSAKSHSNQSSAASSGPKRGHAMTKPSSDRASDPALTGTTVVRLVQSCTERTEDV